MIKKAILFLWNSIWLDMKSARTRFFMFFFNLIPNFYTLKPLRYVFLKFAGVKCSVFGNYIKAPLYIDSASNITIGNNVFMNVGIHIDGNASVKIGSGCQIGPFCKFETTNHRGSNLEFLPVEIGDNVWLGAGCIVLPGAKIASNIVIAAGSVVGGHVAEGVLWAGVPAKKVR